MNTEKHIERMYINLLEVNKNTSRQVELLKEANELLKEQNKMLVKLLEIQSK